MSSVDRQGGTPEDGERAISELLLQAKSPDPEDRFEAAAELTLCPTSPDVDEALIRATSDTDADVVGRAILGLAERGHPLALQLIVRLLDDPHRIVRFSALRSAGVVDISPHLEAAWRALDRRLWVDRAAGAAALARAGVLDALPRIRTLAQQAKAARRHAPESHLLGAASLLGDQGSADLFLGRLASRGHMSRLSAAAFLERRGRIGAMAQIVGADRLRSALLAGKRVQGASRKPGYAREFDDLLRQLDRLHHR